MQHYRTVRSVVGTCVFDLETLRKVEIELNRRALPLAADRVDELEVELGAIKRAAALIERELLSATSHHASEKLFRLSPCLDRAKRLLGHGRKLDRVRIAERREHFIHEIEKPFYLRRHLLRRAEHVCVVLRESADAQHSVKHAAALVAVHSSELGVTD